MFGSTILEVTIGMILIYLVLSLIMTSVQEALHAFRKTRARTLQNALLELMQGDQGFLDRFYDHPLIFALHRGGLTGTISNRKLPSYIPRETFSAALIDIVRRGRAVVSEVEKPGPDAAAGAIPERLQRAIEGMEEIASGRVTAVRTEIERWYDAAMDRASGRFKRHSQAWLLGLSTVVAVALNINSVTLAQYLAVSPHQRDMMTAMAERAVEGDPLRAGEAGAAGGDDPAREWIRDEIRDMTEELYAIGLPIGWSDKSVTLIETGFPNEQVRFGGDFSFAALMAWILLIAGYLITAFAMMLGAPFWFDVLNKFMVIRGTVKPTEKSPDEPSEDGGGKNRQQIDLNLVGAQPGPAGATTAGSAPRPPG